MCLKGRKREKERERERESLETGGIHHRDGRRGTGLKNKRDEADREMRKEGKKERKRVTMAKRQSERPRQREQRGC